MFKRILLVVCCLAAVAAAASPASAAGKKPKKPKIFQNPGYVHKTMALQSGHRYRIDVTAKTKVLVYIDGFETYSWLNHNQLGEATKPFHVKGATPKKVVLTPPIKGALQSWIIGFTVQDRTLRPLTVRVVDLGRQK